MIVQRNIDLCLICIVIDNPQVLHIFSLNYKRWLLYEPCGMYTSSFMLPGVVCSRIAVPRSSDTILKGAFLGSTGILHSVFRSRGAAFLSGL